MLVYCAVLMLTSYIVSNRLAIELVHTINANSPLFNQTSDDLERSDFVLILLASGLDENLHDIVHKKQEYGREAMRWSANFLPMLDWDAHHKFIELDLDKISAVAPLPSNYTDSHAIDMNIPNSPVQEDDLSSFFTTNQTAILLGTQATQIHRTSNPRTPYRTRCPMTAMGAKRPL
ncbi:Potassium channel, inwardly rectifying, Kir [Phytophthora cactorum]|nr:Potassium channel, inwardly rectifying, Kir [Phytophthora cactorum]